MWLLSTHFSSRTNKRTSRKLYTFFYFTLVSMLMMWSCQSYWHLNLLMNSRTTWAWMKWISRQAEIPVSRETTLETCKKYLSKYNMSPRIGNCFSLHSYTYIYAMWKTNLCLVGSISKLRSCELVWILLQSYNKDCIGEWCVPWNQKLHFWMVIIHGHWAELCSVPTHLPV